MCEIEEKVRNGVNLIKSILWNTNWKEVLKFMGRNLDPRLDIGVTNNFWSRSRNGHDEFGHGHVTVTIEICRDRDRESRQFY